MLVTGQHPGLELGDHGLAGFSATPLGCPGQPDPMLHAELVRAAVKRCLVLPLPELLVVQGDTSSALGGALAARDLGITLGHVEAGLRTFDPNLPWPEEENRVAIDRLADLLFAPTIGNAANLRALGATGEIHVTGNSGMDALSAIVGTLPVKRERRWWPRRNFQLLVTCHRRENWGAGLDQLATALTELASQRVHSRILLPPNASVTERLTGSLGGVSGINLVPPQSHPATIAAMRQADLLLSDSGGMQEEAPALGVPLLVLREKTERPEGLVDPSVELVGTESARIVATVNRLRRDRAALTRMQLPRLPFGDGRSAPRIAAICVDYLDRRCRVEESRIA